MFRKQFSDVISKTGMIPLKDLRHLLVNKDDTVISELELLSYGFFDDVKFAQTVSKSYNVPFINLSNTKIDDRYIQLMKKFEIIKYRAIPVKKTIKSVVVAIYDPSVLSEIDALRNILQTNVEFVLTNIGSWSKLYERVKVSIDDLVLTIKEIVPDSVSGEEGTPVFDADDIDDDIIQTVNRILAEAYVKKASDIHIEPYERKFRIRFRMDGQLLEVMTLSKNLVAPVCSRVKIMSQMNISEKRKPQDGRIKLMIGGDPIDYRVSSLPTLFGEKIVLRLLDSSNLELDMTKLGFESKQLDIFKRNIHRPFGMCLVTGPTGSGKTTTLYSALYELNQPEVNISTAEDPVEFNLEGINQVNINRAAGNNFATALKAFLRQDPDIIMVGEIRDFETGEIAIEAALTGHMVLSTLHTNDAPSTVTRLLNMGIEPFLVTGALNVVVAQRLCRKICEHCKREVKVSKEELISVGYGQNAVDHVKTYEGAGCDKCNGTGSKGRIAVYEVFEVSPAIRDLVMRNPSSDDLKRVAIKEGMKTLRMSALTKVHNGLIDLKQAITNTSADKL